MDIEKINNINALLKRLDFKSEDFKTLSESLDQLIIFGACAKPPDHYNDHDEKCLKEILIEAKKASDFLACFSSAIYQ